LEEERQRNRLCLAWRGGEEEDYGEEEYEDEEYEDPDEEHDYVDSEREAVEINAITVLVVEDAEPVTDPAVAQIVRGRFRKTTV